MHEIVDPQIVRTICLARLRSKPCRESEVDFLDELRLAFGLSGLAWLHARRGREQVVADSREIPAGGRLLEALDKVGNLFGGAGNQKDLHVH